MRIAFFSPSADRKNGWGEVTYELCSSYQKEFGNELSVDLYLPESELGKLYIQSLPFRDSVHAILPPFAYSFRNPKRLWQYLSINKLNLKPDFIHALDFPYAVSAWRAAKKFNVPFLVTLCGTFYKPRYFFPDKFLFKEVYRNASHVSAISKFTLDGPRKLFDIDLTKTSIIHAGVNYNRFSNLVDAKSIRSLYGSPEYLIIGIGALKARKGFDIVIRAMAQVRDVYPGAVYVIVGQGSDEKSLRKLVHDLNLEKNIYFATDVSDEDLPAYVHAADIYCHTPRMVDGAFEGFGIVYLQAGAAGKPVVGSQSGGVPDAIVNGKTGLLVPENNVKSTAEALIKILGDKSLRESFGRAGKEYAAEHDWPKIAATYRELFISCTGAFKK
jgi:phosphatidylinositol alpha-1,6-mannosyltransferase